MAAPDGYTIHQTIDLGGRIANITGSGAMYDTLVNLQSGPRVLGETFELHALPGQKESALSIPSWPSAAVSAAIPTTSPS